MNNYLRIMDKINDLRRGNHEYITNIFSSIEELKVWACTSENQIIITDDLLLLLVMDNDLVRVYFSARSISAIKQIHYLISCRGKVILTDIIGKKPAIEDIKYALCNSGFSEDYCFIRMITRHPILPDAETDDVDYAHQYEISQIIYLLKTTFNSIYAHFPEEKEWLEAIEKKEVFVTRCHDKINAFAYVERINEKALCLRYFITASNYQGLGYGNKLLRFSLEQIPDKGYMYLWIGTYNPTIKKYKKYGFIQDDLYDYILLNNGDN